MTDEQVWEDLSRFALAMKRGATVVMNNGTTRPDAFADGKQVEARCIREWGGIREIIEPPQKKVRPLNEEEWKAVAGCLLSPLPHRGQWCLVGYEHSSEEAEFLCNARATCHPPGFPNDVRKLYVEGVA